MPNITLPDGKKLSFDEKVTGKQIVEKISKSLAKEALIMSVDGNLKDLSFEIEKDSKVKISDNNFSKNKTWAPVAYPKIMANRKKKFPKIFQKI